MSIGSRLTHGDLSDSVFFFKNDYVKKKKEAMAKLGGKIVFLPFWHEKEKKMRWFIRSIKSCQIASHLPICQSTITPVKEYEKIYPVFFSSCIIPRLGMIAYLKTNVNRPTFRGGVRLHLASGSRGSPACHLYKWFNNMNRFPHFQRFSLPPPPPTLSLLSIASDPNFENNLRLVCCTRSIFCPHFLLNQRRV